MAFRFGSVCSGIEAASVAWHPLGWETAFVSEIENFPNVVLKYHYPQVPNLGSLMAPDFVEKAKACGPIDLLVGGTPCQSFSVAGLRKGLADGRGNLTLRFVEVAHALRPKYIVWENVPGVLSDKTNAFGCLLAGLTGADAPLQSETGKWANAGIAIGKEYSLSWIVKDAQFFGVPQRRRRVFLVGCLGDWRSPAKVLFESQSLLGDLTEGGEEGEEVAASIADGTGKSGAARTVDFRNLRIDGDKVGTLQAKKTGGYSLNYASGILEPVAEVHAIRGRGEFKTGKPTLRANGGDCGGGSEGLVTHTPRGEGFDASEDGTGRGTPLVAVPHTKTMPTLRAGTPNGGVGHGARSGDSKDEYIVPMAPAQTILDMRGRGDGKVSPTLCTDHPSRPSDYCPIVFAQNQTGEVRTGKKVGTLNTNANASGSAPVVYSLMPQNSGKDFKAREVNVTQPLMASGPTHGNQGGDIVFQQNSRSEVRVVGGEKPVAGAVTSEPGAQCQNYLYQQSSVRRLTPTECERLQGFRDRYTFILFREKDSKDGPRYKALGNSMAVPCMAWIGWGIQMVEDEKNLLNDLL